MLRVLNYADEPQHPDDGLHHGSLAQQQLDLAGHYPTPHVPFNPSDLPVPLLPEPLGEALGDLPLVANQPAE